MRALRLLGWLAGTAAALAVLVLAVAVIGLNTDPGRRLAERLTARATGGQVTLAGLAGRFPTALRLQRLDIRDGQGVWLSVQDAALDWSPAGLLAGEARIARLAAGLVALPRPPVAAAPAPPAAGGREFNLPVAVEVALLQVGRLELGAPVAGAAAVLSVEGHARLASLWTGEAVLSAERLDGPGSYRVDGRLDAASVRARLQAREPARGLVSEAAGLPELGAITAVASVDGPWSGVAFSASASAGGLRAEAAGRLDLQEMAGDIDLTASAPAMRPRAELAWQGMALEAHAHGRFTAPEATASLQLDGLEAGGAGLQRLSAQASGHAGAATLEATAEGLRIPDLVLPAAPLRLTLAADLAAADRPVRFSLLHPLAGIEGTARTAGALAVDARVTLPDLAPLAASGGLDVRGSAALTVKAARDAGATRLDIDGTLGVTGGSPPLPALIGPDGTVGLSAVLAGPEVTLSRLELNGRTLTLAAQGGLHGEAVALDWRAGLADLTALAGPLEGSLTAQGHASGRRDDFSVTADISGDLATTGNQRGPMRVSVQAQGLPAHPAGTLTAEGTLDGAKLSLAAQGGQADDGALHLEIPRADWRSAHADGQLDLPPGAALPLGTMRLTVGDLADFARFVGQKLAGGIDAALRTEQQDGAPVAVLDVKARNAGLPGQATVGEATLAARVRDPAGGRFTEARLSVAGLRAGGIGGGFGLNASGPETALGLKLSASLTGVGGAGLTTQSAATLDLPGRTLAVASLQAGWKGETLRLLAPARLSFADGLAVDRLRLGLRQAVLDVAGRVSPTLDLTASLRNVTADLARVFVPDLEADGRLEADAKLGGTAAQPTGTVRLAATGLRLRNGEAAGLPPASVTANATLQGTAARLDAALTAGRNRLTLAGTAPLNAAAAMDLRAAGTLDLASLDPILSANGRRVRGLVTLDTRVTGRLAAPNATGTLRLANGEVQDFVLGARLDDIEAVVQANGQTLTIVRLTARAGRGTLSAAGTVGLAAPLPVALTLTARNASPLASDKLTAVLDADLSLRGAAAGRLDVAGKVTLQRADIRIPENLPGRLAVLDVRRPGQKPPPPPSPAPDIGLDVTLTSPGQIFVRGRGLDAELAGNLHIGGSVAAPHPDGSFKLRYGQYSLAGVSLDFTRGEVGFDGSGKLDPTLNFLATSSNASVTANLAITGYASDPKFTLSSVPELPQDEVLAWLIFHQSAASLGPLQWAQIAAAVAQLSGVGGGFDPLSSLRSGLGLDRLSVGTSVEAGRYVAPGVYVGARQSTTGGGTQGVMQIDLARGLKLEATVGQSTSATGASETSQGSGTSVGVTYQFEY
jgi:translocation and assembly module TamB